VIEARLTGEGAKQVANEHDPIAQMFEGLADELQAEADRGAAEVEGDPAAKQVWRESAERFRRLARNERSRAAIASDPEELRELLANLSPQRRAELQRRIDELRRQET
jgi:hypothetical protein